MTAGELAVVLAALLCSIGFAALIVVLLRVLDAMRALRHEVLTLRQESLPLLAELRSSTADAKHTMEQARDDLERFDRVLGSAEAISGAVAKAALSAPVIKTAALAAGTTRAIGKLRRKERRSA
jgi:hypothetical protein